MTPAFARPARSTAAGLLLLAAAGFAACGGGGEEMEEPDDPIDPRLGGDTTTLLEGSPPAKAFTMAARNLAPDRVADFKSGDFIFGRTWVSAPASTTGFDGLGPTFNARSCSTCHERDGRGRPPAGPEEPMSSMLVRLSVPGEDERGGPKPEPRYGGQLNDRAIQGVPAEGRATVTYEERPGQYADGTPYSLREPSLGFVELAFGPLAPDTLSSPRVAPAMIGLGLLEAIPEATLLALADEADADGDGISGRPNFVWDSRRGAPRVGRFGWKANKPTLEEQSAGAFLGDLGLTTPLHPHENCPEAQADCRRMPSGVDRPGDTEISQAQLDSVVFYARLLGVPAMRDADAPEVRRGRRLFREAGCARCHVERLETGELPGVPEVERQIIHPYTDLLLHDMGEELADGRPDFRASGREWRTPPLWGLGLVQAVNGHTNLLHDGRARDAAEAILWHGGEAEPAREAFRSMSAPDRAALLRFLGSL